MSWTLRIGAGVAVAGVAAIGWLLGTSPSFTAYDFLAEAGGEPSNDSGTFVELHGSVVELRGSMYDKREVVCASVLAGPPSDHPDDRAEAARKYNKVRSYDDESGGPTEDDPRRDEGREADDWLAGDCDRLREQRLGFALLAGVVPLLVGGVAAFTRLHQLTREAAHAGPDDGWSQLLARARGDSGGSARGSDEVGGEVPPDPSKQGASSRGR